MYILIKYALLQYLSFDYKNLKYSERGLIMNLFLSQIILQKSQSRYFWVLLLACFFIGYPRTAHALGESTIAKAKCAIAYKSCRKEAEKLILMMNHSNPCFAFDKEMAYSHCSFASCMCRCTGEGMNEFSNEAGTQTACAVTCKVEMPNKNDPAMQQCINSHIKNKQ